MKKLLLISIIALSYLPISAQTVLNGVGILKLDSDTTILNELGYPKEIITVDNSRHYFSNVYEEWDLENIYELKYKKGEWISDVSPDQRVRVFYVSKYEVVPNIILREIVLKFFDGKLYEIKSRSNNKLTEALTLKYGEPKLNLNKEDKTFTYTYTGATVVKEDITITMSWITNVDDISCVDYKSKYHNSKGEEQRIDFFRIINRTIYEIVKDAEKTIKQQEKEEQEKIFLKTIEDL